MNRVTGGYNPYNTYNYNRQNNRVAEEEQQKEVSSNDNEVEGYIFYGPKVYHKGRDEEEKVCPNYDYTVMRDREKPAMGLINKVSSRDFNKIAKGCDEEGVGAQIMSNLDSLRPQLRKTMINKLSQMGSNYNQKAIDSYIDYCITSMISTALFSNMATRTRSPHGCYYFDNGTSVEDLGRHLAMMIEDSMNSTNPYFYNQFFAESNERARAMLIQTSDYFLTEEERALKAKIDSFAAYNF